MSSDIRMPKTIWEEIIRVIVNRLTKGILDKPVVFALYTSEHDHHEIVDYREITSVVVRGNYPNGDYNYFYPGIKKEGFYPPKNTGEWFSGTLVVGDSTEIDELDKRWMIRDKMDFRIKMNLDSLGQLTWKAYYMDFPEVSLKLQ